MTKKKTEPIYKQFRDLMLKKKTKEAELEDIKDAIEDLKDIVFKKFEEDGTSSIKLETGETLYIHSQYWARPNEKHDKEDVIKALRKVGLGHLISEGYNTNSLSSVIREMKKSEEEIPKELQKVIEVENAFDIRINGLKVKR